MYQQILARFCQLSTIFAVSLLPAAVMADPAVEVGVFGGVHGFNDASELGVLDQDPGFAIPSLKTAPILGGRGTLRPLPFLSVEAEVAAIPTQVKASTAANIPSAFDVMVLVYRAHVVGELGALLMPDSRLEPFVVLGLGGQSSVASDDQQVLSKDTDLVFHAGTGARFQIREDYGVRLDARVLMSPSAHSDGYKADVLNWEVSAGVFYTFGARSKTMARASQDAVLPQASPVEVLPAATPVEPPSDLDGDGIPDDSDQCADAAEDMDGYQDADGCPDHDSDGDGVDDSDDKCPDQPETTNQYEDEDGCPDQLPPPPPKFTGSLSGVRFKGGSATIDPSAYRALDESAKLLAEHPSIRVEVQGHTDARGEQQSNLALSQARADAVVRYLVGKGIAADRLTAKGYGSSAPRADNATRQGREQNRRVELHPIE